MKKIKRKKSQEGEEGRAMVDKTEEEKSESIQGLVDILELHDAMVARGDEGKEEDDDLFYSDERWPKFERIAKEIMKSWPSDFVNKIKREARALMEKIRKEGLHFSLINSSKTIKLSEEETQFMLNNTHPPYYLSIHGVESAVVIAGPQSKPFWAEVPIKGLIEAYHIAKDKGISWRQIRIPMKPLENYYGQGNKPN